MSSPVALRNQYGYLFGATMLPVLEELFKSDFMQHPSRRKDLFKIVAHDRDIWQYTELHDMELFSQIDEGTEYSLTRPKQGAAKTLSMVKFGLGFSISEEMVADGKFDLIADMVRKLSRSAAESQEIQAMNIFNNGFSSELSADGLSVFNAAHTLPSGLTYRNKLSTDADLSVTSLEQALKDFETQFIGDSGIIENIRPRNLVVPSGLRRYAAELLGSDQKADTVDNNLNSFKQEGLRVISSPHLTDTNAWFITADPSDTGLRVIEREPISTKAAGGDAGFMTDSIIYKARYREKVGCVHPKGIFGTSGST